MSRTNARRGFSFAEVMFAVIILGVGFIMIAAVFPVAIRQSKSTSDETTAAAQARGAANLVDQIAHYSAAQPWLPATGGEVKPLSPGDVNTLEAWKAIRGNLILSDDPRYAFIPLFRRDGAFATVATWQPYAQVYVICVQSQNKPIFESTDVVPDPAAVAKPANLMPRPFTVDLAAGNAVDPSTATFIVGGPAPVDASLPPSNLDILAEGAFVIIAKDNITTPLTNVGRMNGRIYRLGTRRTDRETATNRVFELAPGYEFKGDPGADGAVGPPPLDADNITALTGAWAYVIGRGMNSTGTGYEGTAMDVSVYATFVYVKP